jgi:indolepyruvate ferredoxin oxidoreductase alpha subunit
MSLNYLGVSGGMVVVVADDPGPISSQTEQDTRHFGRYAKLAVFDPSTAEEAYLMIGSAFECSEKYGRPVIFRPTTRVCHSYASVEILPDMEWKKPLGFDKSGGRWVIFPSLAFKNHGKIEAALKEMAGEFVSHPGNGLEEFPSGKTPSLGIAAGGVSYAYAREVLASMGSDFGAPTVYRLLKLGTYPFPEKLGLSFLRDLKEVLVLEELDPVIEDELIRLSGVYRLKTKIRGKRSGDMPLAGENTPGVIGARLAAFLRPRSGASDVSGAEAASSVGVIPEARPAPSALKGGTGDRAGQEPLPPELPVRPPVLCAGCPHRASFFAIKEAVRKYGRGRKAVFSGDIGCYTLGNARPLDMVDTCLCMGAGITMAQGINRVEKDTLNFAFIGDSTFFHTGIPGLINAVYNQANIIVVILDNLTTAMTGNQPHPGTGRTARGEGGGKISIPKMVSALGIKDLERVNPFDIAVSEEAVARSMEKTGVRVLLFEAPCISVYSGGGSCVVDRTKCEGCQNCVRKLGCPALSLVVRPRTGTSGGESAVLQARIDPVLCTGCGVCKSLCRFNAIGNGRP